MCHLCDRKCLVVGSKVHEGLGLILHEHEDKTVETVATLIVDENGIRAGEVLNNAFHDLAYAEAEYQDAKYQEQKAQREQMLREMGPLGAILGGMIGG